MMALVAPSLGVDEADMERLGRKSWRAVVDGAVTRISLRSPVGLLESEVRALLPTEARSLLCTLHDSHLLQDERGDFWEVIVEEFALGGSLSHVANAGGLAPAVAMQTLRAGIEAMAQVDPPRSLPRWTWDGVATHVIDYLDRHQRHCPDDLSRAMSVVDELRRNAASADDRWSLSYGDHHGDNVIVDVGKGCGSATVDVRVIDTKWRVAPARYDLVSMVAWTLTEVADAKVRCELQSVLLASEVLVPPEHSRGADLLLLLERLLGRLLHNIEQRAHPNASANEPVRGLHVGDVVRTVCDIAARDMAVPLGAAVRTLCHDGAYSDTCCAEGGGGRG